VSYPGGGSIGGSSTLFMVDFPACSSVVGLMEFFLLVETAAHFFLVDLRAFLEERLSSLFIVLLGLLSLFDKLK
jgi:hypothetical protein